MVFDSKMLVEMIFLMMSLNILIGTILTFVQFIVVNTHMLLQIILNFKSRLTIWFQAFVPKIAFVSHYVDLSMVTQIFLNFFLNNFQSNDALPSKKQHSYNYRIYMDKLPIYAHLSCDLSIHDYQSL